MFDVCSHPFLQLQCALVVLCLALGVAVALSFFWRIPWLIGDRKLDSYQKWADRSRSVLAVVVTLALFKPAVSVLPQDAFLLSHAR